MKLPDPQVGKKRILIHTPSYSFLVFDTPHSKEQSSLRTAHGHCPPSFGSHCHHLPPPQKPPLTPAYPPTGTKLLLITDVCPARQGKVLQKLLLEPVDGKAATGLIKLELLREPSSCAV